MKAKTTIMRDNRLFNLSNKLIVDYLSRHLDLSDAVVHNPYFIYNLFNIFYTSKDLEQTIKVYKDKISINTPYYEYEIVVNGDNGLTAVIDDTSDDYGDMYFKIRKIVEVIPDGRGIKVIRHNASITGNLVSFNCEVTNSLKILNIDECGIASSMEEVRINRYINSGLFNQKVDITPSTLEEYIRLLEEYKKQKECDYKYINRNDINSININESHNGKLSSERRYFHMEDVLDIIDITESNYTIKGTNIDKIKAELICLDVSNETEAIITNEIGRRLGMSLNKKGMDSISLRDKKLVTDILTPSKQLKK